MHGYTSEDLYETLIMFKLLILNVMINVISKCITKKQRETRLRLCVTLYLVCCLIPTNVTWKRPQKR